MSSQGKKRALVKQQQQVRQGSSFSNCPGCGLEVYTALMPFHISSCYVFEETRSTKSTVNPRNRETPKEGEGQKIRSTINFGCRESSTSAVNEEGKLSGQLGRAYGEERGTGCSLDWIGAGVTAEKLVPGPETPSQGRDSTVCGRIQTAAPVSGTRTPDADTRKRLFEDWGQKLSPEREVVQSSSDVASEGSQSKRPKVTENCGRSLKLNEVRDWSGAVDSDGDDGVANMKTPPHLSIRDSQREMATEQAFCHIEKLTQELGKGLGNQGKSHGDIKASPSEIYDGGYVGAQIDSRIRASPTADNEVGDIAVSKREPSVKSSFANEGECTDANRSQRENVFQSDFLDLKVEYSQLKGALQVMKEQWEEMCRREQEAQKEILVLRSSKGELETALQEMSKRYADAVRKETESERALHVMKKEWEEVRAKEYETQNKILSMREFSPKLKQPQRQHEEDGSMATQFLSEGLKPEVSSGSKEALEKNVTTGGGIQGFAVKHDLSKNKNEERAQLLCQPLHITSSSEVPSSKSSCRGLERKNSSDGAMTDNPHGDTTLVPANLLSKLLHHSTETPTGTALSTREATTRTLQSFDCPGASVFAPMTPGKPLIPGYLEHERREGRESVTAAKNGTRYMMGHQRADGINSTPGGPQTPDKVALVIGAREKGLISDLLQSFPPAKGTESQGIDPFDHEFVNAAATSDSHVRDILDGSSPASEIKTVAIEEGMELSNDGRCTQKVGIKPVHSAGTPKSKSSNNSEEETLGQAMLKVKRKKLAVVLDSDSDGDIGDQVLRHDAPHLKEGKEGSANSREIMWGPSLCESVDRPNPEIDGGHASPDHSILGLQRNKRSLSPNLVRNLFPTEEGEDVPAESPGKSRKGKLRRLVRVQGSPRTGIVNDQATAEGTKPTVVKAVRRSERLRNTSASKEGLSCSDEYGSSLDVGKSRGGNRRGSQPQVISLEESDSGSSDLELEPIKKASISREHVEVRRDSYGSKLEVDDDEYEDSSFINDDPESDANSSGQSFSAVWESTSDSGEGSKSSGGSLSSRGSSEKHRKFKWELEGDMLAALAKDSELCLRGLCALYRRQEEDEQRESVAKYRNKLGFDKFHAAKASRFAVFLLGSGSDSLGPVTKTAAQLEQRFGDGAVSYCTDMCIHHSKQLFDIYEKDKDPYFP